MEIFFFNTKPSAININPINLEQQKINKLENELRLIQITPLHLEIFNYREEAEFTVNQDGQSIKVIISLKDDSLPQVAALQKILKKANIKKGVKLIDLSSIPAYATLQNL
jgi:hypothetical protein